MSDQNDKYKGLQLIPETVLKKKHDLDEMKATRVAQQLINPRGNTKVFSSKAKAVKIAKPEKYVARARSRLHHTRRLNRVLKKGMQKRASNKKITESKVVYPDGLEDDLEQKFATEVNYASNSVGSKLVFCVRIRDDLGAPKDVSRVLSHLRLRNVNEGVFVRYNTSGRKQLHLIEPWITYGVVSKSVITDLINRRGHGKIDKKRVPLTDNTIIEKALCDETEILCVEDLVHEIFNVGDDFGKANSFLWPFRLSAPKSKFQKQKLNFKDGGDYGDRGEEMDDLIRQML
jgi:large subunit ribosomal protein L7e